MRTKISKINKFILLYIQMYLIAELIYIILYEKYTLVATLF
jgi:hypothetical protein